MKRTVFGLVATLLLLSSVAGVSGAGAAEGVGSVDDASISGTVTDAGDASPLANAGVSLLLCDVGEVGSSVFPNCDFTELVFTEADGTYSFTGLAAGTYQVYFHHYFHIGQCYDGDPTYFDCALIDVGEGEAVGGIDAALEPLPAGSISGAVTDDLTGEPLEGVMVTACPVDFGTECQSDWTGGSGEYTVGFLGAGEHTVSFSFDEYRPECFDDDPTFLDCVEVMVEADLPTTGIDAGLLDLVVPCVPSVAATGLTNMGFETGDLTGWTLGTVTEEVVVTGADAFTAPYEGGHMLRLAATKDSFQSQPPGPNTVCQDFVVDSATEQFVYNVFTYDYTGYDEFDFTARVVDPDTGEVLAAETQGAWGVGTELKTSGWRGIEMDLADHLGQTVQIQISAGGTSDSLLGFWAYVDSAESGLPPEVGSSLELDAPGASVMSDPVTGQVTVAMPFAGVVDLPFTASPICADESAPTGVSLLLNGAEFPMTEADGTWSVTIPESSVSNGVLSLQVACDGAATIVTVVGSIVLYDPSGYVTDVVSGDPVVGAEVTLYQVPGWSAATEVGDLGPNECQSNLSKGEEDPWSQPAPTELGVQANPFSGLISPAINPFLTNDEGYYGWDVAAGCWYVVVQAEGYDLLVSPVVGVPPEVTDLDLELTPADLVTVPGAPTGVTGVAGPGEVEVTWTVPASNGGSPITGYTVTAAPGGATCTTTGATTCTVEGLAAVPYTFTVVATNEVGDGPASAPSAPVTPLAVSECGEEGDGPFPDVAADHTFCVDVEWLAASGVTGGFLDGTFRPGAPVTRGSMAAFLYRYAGEPDFEAPATSPFSDVATDHVFYEEITWLADSGVTGGFTDGTFRPGAPVTRGSMAAFLYRFAGEPAFEVGEPSFSDVPTSHPFFDEVEWLADSGVTGGFTDGTFRPGSSVTRGSMAAFLHRFDDLD